MKKNRTRQLATRRLINRTRVVSRFDLRFCRHRLNSLDLECSPGILLSLVTGLYFPAPFRTTHSGPLIACSTAISTDQLEEIFPSLRVGDKNESVRLIRSPLPVELEVKRGFASGTPGRSVNDAISPRMRCDESLRSVLAIQEKRGGCERVTLVCVVSLLLRAIHASIDHLPGPLRKTKREQAS